MAEALKVLGQVAPAATTETDLYNTPAATSATLQVVIVNRGASSGTVRVSLSAEGAATANTDYLAYDLPVGAKETITLSGIAVQADWDLRVYASSADFSFTATGVEVT